MNSLAAHIDCDLQVDSSMASGLGLDNQGSLRSETKDAFKTKESKRHSWLCVTFFVPLNLHMFLPAFEI
jgi:hypothetical protein